jgi:hypothetical protein
MSYIDALNACNLSEEALNELYNYMDTLTDANELHLLKYPHYMEKLINIIVKPDAILVCNILTEPYKPFLDRVLIYKDGIRAPLSVKFPNEYTFMKRLTGT